MHEERKIYINVKAFDVKLFVLLSVSIFVGGDNMDSVESVGKKSE
jgi:hypothetical protein